MRQDSPKRYKLIESFNAAIEGFLYVIKTQRNMRLHFLLGLFVVLLGIYLNFKRAELMLLCFTVSLVLITEMINTAIEIVLDSVASSYAHWVRVVKDITAGSVLIASINAIVVGYFMFFNNIILDKFENGITTISHSDWHISFIILFFVIGIVIAGKTVFHKGKPLRGGMPSGHAALAFSIWILVVLISKNPLLIFIVFIMAMMIAQSRISRHYHTVWEVAAGALIGSLVTTMIYRFFMGR